MFQREMRWRAQAPPPDILLEPAVRFVEVLVAFIQLFVGRLQFFIECQLLTTVAARAPEG